MRSRFRLWGCATGVFLAVLAFAASVPVAKADTFDFSFTTQDGLYSASGFFTTLPYSILPSGQPAAFDGYAIMSLKGQMDGSTMTLAPMFSAIDGDLTFLNYNLNFTVNGRTWTIFLSDSEPIAGNNLYSNFYPNSIGHYLDFIGLTVVRTPEPSSLLLLGIGFFPLAAVALTKLFAQTSP